MPLNIRALTYVPTLFVRPAEMLATEELPALDKTDLHPIFLVRPWMSSNHLNNTMDRIRKSVGDGEYFVDLDPYYAAGEVARPAHLEFQNLFDSNDGYKNWFDFVEENDGAVPCLRLENAIARDLPRQIERATALQRGFVARICHQRTEEVANAIDQICETEHGEFAFVIDLGWGRDILLREAWATNLIENITGHRPEIPIIVSGSSFPDSFGDFQVGERVTLHERTIFQNLVRRHNAATLIYGDWGSSREPSNGGGRPIPRIDLPNQGDWAVFRFRVEDGGYRSAAAHALAEFKWTEDLDIWGTYVIRGAADGAQFGVSSPFRATAARINIHLHTQLRYDQPQMFIETEDEYVE